MVKCYIFVWDNGKSQSTILIAPGYALLEMSINQGQEGLTKFYSMFAEFFKKSDRVHAFPAVATTQQREWWTHHPCGAVVTDTKESDSDEEDSVMPPLIYPEGFNDEDSMNEPTSVEPTL